MKRAVVFAARFALAPILTGSMVVSVGAGSSAFERAHAVIGFATIYLVFGLLVLAAKERALRIPAAVALLLALIEALPAMPMLHAVVAPFLFATLAWAGYARSRSAAVAPEGGLAILMLPLSLAIPIAYGVAYRHQTAGLEAHLGSAMLVGGAILIAAVVFQQQHPDRTNLVLASQVALGSVLLQVVFGMAAMVIRMLEVENGLLLAVVRAIHIAGAAPLLAATIVMVSEYRRKSRIPLSSGHPGNPMDTVGVQ